MNILLDRLIPLPIAEIPHKDSGIWEVESVIIETGKKYLLTAASGKGKTTLLSILYGIRKDFDGDVLIDGENIRNINDRQWARFRKHQFSYIFQGLELFDDLTAMDNILLKNRQTGYYPENTIMSMAALLEVDQFLSHKVNILSYGQKQRIAIIRALCQPFKFLFADEILAHLDIELSKKTFDLVASECRKRDAGLLFTALDIPPELGFDVHYRI